MENMLCSNYMKVYDTKKMSFVQWLPWRCENPTYYFTIGVEKFNLHPSFGQYLGCVYCGYKTKIIKWIPSVSFDFITEHETWSCSAVRSSTDVVPTRTDVSFHSVFDVSFQRLEQKCWGDCFTIDQTTVCQSEVCRRLQCIAPWCWALASFHHQIHSSKITEFEWRWLALCSSAECNQNAEQTLKVLQQNNLQLLVVLQSQQFYRPV